MILKKKPIIERVFTFIGSAVGFICGLIVAGALVENGNKDATIIVMGLLPRSSSFDGPAKALAKNSIDDGWRQTKSNQPIIRSCSPANIRIFLE